MRIALITREYPPETSWGGIGTHYAAFARGLKDAGCDVEVFTQGLKRATAHEEGGIIIHRLLPRRWVIGRRVGGDLGGGTLSTIGLFALSLSMEMCRVFSMQHRERPFDVVEGHEHLGVNCIINKRFSRSLVTVTRYQTTYHSMVSRDLANWPKSYLVRFLEHISITAANCRIATSDFIDSLSRQDFPGIPRADTFIPNLTSVKVCAIGEYKREPLIVFVGRMMPGHKNPDMAAKAFVHLANQYPEWRIEFAGNDILLGSGETMWDKCREILKHYEGRYRYHGLLSQEPLKELYRRARIIIVPSTIESYGLVAQEAMALGCVPVVSSNTSLPEVVGDAGIVFRNGSLEDLVSKLDSLLSNVEEQVQRSFACVDRVRKVYGEASIIRSNLDFFEKMIAIKSSKKL